MKFRSLFLILLAVLLVFALASCKNDVEEEEKWVEIDPYPYLNYEPTDNEIYQITITDGVDQGVYSYDKLKLVFTEPVEQGAVLKLKYRTERQIYQWDIRDGSMKWVYETSKNNFVEPVLDKTSGWYSLEYTFADTDITGATITYPYENGFGIFFRGWFLAGDIFEIMDITLNDVPLVIDADTITSAAVLSEEPVLDHVWEIPQNYAVLFLTGALYDEDKNPLVEKVIAGTTVDFAPFEDKGNYEVYSDSAKTKKFNVEKQVLEDGFRVYYTIK